MPVASPLPKVLVADDEPQIRTLVAQTLRSLGCEVLEAADGEEGWLLWNEHRPVLLVLDVMMPLVTGWELCRRVKEGAGDAAPKVLMLTGVGPSLNDMTSPLFQADAWIDKPFGLDALAEKARALLRTVAGTARMSAKVTGASQVKSRSAAAPAKSKAHAGKKVAVKAPPKRASAKPAPAKGKKPAPAAKARRVTR